MKPIFSALVMNSLLLASASAQEVSDPIADFLSLPVEDRYGEASSVVRIEKVTIDIDLDGVSELLVGHHKMWLGDNKNIYFAIYRKLASGGYKRLTKISEDIGLELRGGRPEFNFVGKVDELSETGLLICNPPQGDGRMAAKKIESRVFVSIVNDAVKVMRLPGLDLAKPEDAAAYARYFPKPGHQGGYHAESITAAELAASGTTIPDWTKMPPVVNQNSITPSGTPQVTYEPSKKLSATQPPTPKKVPQTDPAPVTWEEEPTSSTPWTIAAVVIAAVVIALALLLLKGRK